MAREPVYTYRVGRGGTYWCLYVGDRGMPVPAGEVPLLYPFALVDDGYLWPLGAIAWYNHEIGGYE
jgi:hypothetical protein